MKHRTGNSIRLVLAALLTIGGLVAIVIGIAMGMAPANAPICDLATTCIAPPAAPAVADSVRGPKPD
jgi:hypothetical protein